jgi:hypothetical protein
MRKPFTTIAIGVLGLIAVLHVLRLFFQWPATINGIDIPIWASILGAIVAAVLALMVQRES